MARSRRSILTMNRRGTVTIPKEVRRELGEGSVFEAIRREDGVIELRPQAIIDASQRWFWSERWQQMEREADSDIAAGRVRVFDDVEGLLSDLEDGDGKK